MHRAQELRRLLPLAPPVSRHTRHCGDANGDQYRVRTCPPVGDPQPCRPCVAGRSTHGGWFDCHATHRGLSGTGNYQHRAYLSLVAAGRAYRRRPAHAVVHTPPIAAHRLFRRPACGRPAFTPDRGHHRDSNGPYRQSAPNRRAGANGGRWPRTDGRDRLAAHARRGSGVFLRACPGALFRQAHPRCNKRTTCRRGRGKRGGGRRACQCTDRAGIHAGSL